MNCSETCTKHLNLAKAIGEIKTLSIGLITKPGGSGHYCRCRMYMILIIIATAANLPPPAQAGNGRDRLECIKKAGKRVAEVGPD
ncbi:unnamed protein product [Heligmosomoides polygyrus]|uniref:Secreted protein n=1 Tax=Heligmosomoides polygyrus TaxID=6339 RepID=A0A183F696_HELPZ|nr:unnamed protein product [Heligmosomoides polygyrus]